MGSDRTGGAATKVLHSCLRKEELYAMFSATCRGHAGSHIALVNPINVLPNFPSTQSSSGGPCVRRSPRCSRRRGRSGRCRAAPSPCRGMFGITRSVKNWELPPADSVSQAERKLRETVAPTNLRISAPTDASLFPPSNPPGGARSAGQCREPGQT